MMLLVLMSRWGKAAVLFIIKTIVFTTLLLLIRLLVLRPCFQGPGTKIVSGPSCAPIIHGRNVRQKAVNST